MFHWWHSKDSKGLSHGKPQTGHLDSKLHILTRRQLVVRYQEIVILESLEDYGAIERHWSQW